MINDTRTTLEALERGEISVDEALTRIKTEPFEDIGYAKVDMHRKVRQGFSEVIYGAGKTPEQIRDIAAALLQHGQKLVLITRMNEAAAELTGKSLPLQYYQMGRIGIVGDLPEPDGDGSIVVATGGTSDIPVAEEAALVAEALGNKVVRLYDVGVAGLHRLLACTDELRAARVVVAVAGMEGALPSVIGGLVEAPVIAVPTSVGYGASFGGVEGRRGRHRPSRRCEPLIFARRTEQ